MPKDHHALAKHPVRIRLLQVPQSADSLTCICTKCQGANRRVISIVRPGGSIPSKKPTSRSSGSTWLNWRDRDGYLMSFMTFHEVRRRSAMENFLINFIIMYCSNFPVDLDRAIHKPRCLQREIQVLLYEWYNGTTKHRLGVETRAKIYYVRTHSYLSKKFIIPQPS